MEDKLYSVKEVAESLKISKNIVYNLINSGLLPAYKLGSYKIRESSIDTFLDTYNGMDLSDTDNVVSIKDKHNKRS